jgi:uncharacterized membrane protein
MVAFSIPSGPIGIIAALLVGRKKISAAVTPHHPAIHDRKRFGLRSPPVPSPDHSCAQQGAAPYLILAARPALPIAVTAVAVASVGYCASLLLQERLMELTPDELSGQALGLASSGTVAMQGIGAAVAGAVAQLGSPGLAMATMAAVSLAVTLILAPRLRPAIRGREAARPGRTARHSET